MVTPERSHSVEGWAAWPRPRHYTDNDSWLPLPSGRLPHWATARTRQGLPGSAQLLLWRPLAPWAQQAEQHPKRPRPLLRASAEVEHCGWPEHNAWLHLGGNTGQTDQGSDPSWVEWEEPQPPAWVRAAGMQGHRQLSKRPSGLVSQENVLSPAGGLP